MIIDRSTLSLTVQQKAIVNFILDFYLDNDRMPSYSEIGESIRIARCTAKFHCDALHKKGLFVVKYKPGKELRMRKDGYRFCHQMTSWYIHNDRYEIVN